MKYEFTDCKVVDIRQESDLVRRFFIRYPDSVSFHFHPGQFMMLNLPIESKYTNRAFSIASAPADDNVIELAVSMKPTGKGTQFLWDEVKIGSTLSASLKALGKFALPENIDRELCFICTGTGIGPLRSMMLHILKQNIPHQKIVLISGNRTEKDILYRTEFEELEKRNSGFHFVPVLSRGSTEWKGRRGHVHEAYKELYNDHRPAYFVLCGWGEMLREARKNLQDMGYDRPFIKFETYD